MTVPGLVVEAAAVRRVGADRRRGRGRARARAGHRRRPSSRGRAGRRLQVPAGGGAGRAGRAGSVGSGSRRIGTRVTPSGEARTQLVERLLGALAAGVGESQKMPTSMARARSARGRGRRRGGTARRAARGRRAGCAGGGEARGVRWREKAGAGSARRSEPALLDHDGVARPHRVGDRHRCRDEPAVAPWRVSSA